MTNGEVYLFVRLAVGRFQLFPYLVVSSPRQTERVLEVLIAIGRDEVVT